MTPRHPIASRLINAPEFRVFYDVLEGQVIVTAVLHKRETAGFYRGEPR